MKKFEELELLVQDLQEEADKFYNKGNKAAGTRLRKGCQNIKNVCQEIRVEVSELKKTEEIPA
tara:strand:+ start:1570 stop:1758 length:189 start_codon:yes stop_codon:yes gene_type:complete